MPGRFPIGETATDVKTVEKALEIFDVLWERHAEFEDEVAPPGFEEAVREAWDSIIDSWEIDNE